MTTTDPRHLEWQANDWYLEGASGARHSERWIGHSAALAARATGKPQVVHKHAQVVNGERVIGLWRCEPCGLADCYVIRP